MICIAAPLDDEVAALFKLRPDLIADRYRLYRRLRTGAPVLQTNDIVILTRHADLERLFVASEDEWIIDSTNLESSERRAEYERLPDELRPKMAEYWAFRSVWVTSTNGEQHKRLRQLAHRAFTPRTIARLQARIEEIAEELLDEMIRRDDEVADLIGQFAWKLPLTVISEMLDVSIEERAQIRQWSVDVASFSGASGDPTALQRAHGSLFQLKTHLAAVFASRRSSANTTDLMSALLAAESDEHDRFTHDELVGMIAQLIWAGHETTTNLIGNGMLALLSNRSQWDILREDPAATAGAVDECLRYYSPTQITRRMAVRDADLHEMKIPRHQSLLFMLGAANRDPDVFEQPDEFRITRASKRHFAFGLGPHFCLGASLARLEGAVALSALARRFPEIDLVSAVPQWNANTTFLGLKELPVRLGRDHG